MEYLKIQIESDGEIRKVSVFEKILTFFIPKANPDYDEKIGIVEFWLLEFESKESLPVREIGLTPFGDAILKIPYKENYGYWTDNNIKYPFFTKNFPCEVITAEYFESQWEQI